MASRLEESLSLFEKIEKISGENNIGYLEALSRYMVEHDLKAEKLAKLICPKLKELIREEAESQGLVPRLRNMFALFK